MQISTPPPISSGSSGASSRAGHRSQEQRRDATRTALLEATIECLATYGYAKTTTGRIAELANVSRGAQPLYFRTRAELFHGAFAYLTERRVEAAREAFAGGPVSLEVALDTLWEAHQGPTFDAALEIWVAARTDPDLREVMYDLEREVAISIAHAAAGALGEFAQRPTFIDDLVLALATIRGLAMLQISHGESPQVLARYWTMTRTRLVALLG
ncbi:TetR/AcrR family transcriptional regulator [Actinomadura barringtoniae]|uniref:TetR/AcrR family transcriptional regulator n=1 Tax=Actinomadura barringtoniae TaxID=1427535 RepID=A0A939T4Z1_9ACTN|nr:TetR/AcrR family transcriptional regulator [Actinomadura barringtoniae]MBO2453141.1 TetR/AcrR family transcriptional regulator [Actinomadura barringtoniae]